MDKHELVDRIQILEIESYNLGVQMNNLFEELRIESVSHSASEFVAKLQELKGQVELVHQEIAELRKGLSE